MLYFGITEIYNHWKRTVMIAVMIALITFVTIILVTTYKAQYGRYNPFKELLSEEGFAFGIGTPEVNNYGGVENFLDGLHKVEDYHYIYQTGVRTDKGKFQLLGYDEVVNEYIPALAEGVWFTEAESEAIPVVVSQNPYGVNAGDRINHVSPSGEETPLYVCGILENGASAYTTNHMAVDYSLFDFYETFDLTQEDTLIGMFISMENMEKLGYSGVGGRLIVKCDESITDEEMRENRILLNQRGAIIVIELEDVRERTELIILNKLLSITCVAVVLFVFASIGMACMIGIDVSTNLRNYAVFYSCGMSWKQCISINAIQSALTGVAGVMMAILAGNLMKIYVGKNSFLFELEGTQLLACVGIVTYLVLLSVIIPLGVLAKNSPKDVLQQANL